MYWQWRFLKIWKLMAVQRDVTLWCLVLKDGIFNVRTNTQSENVNVLYQELTVVTLHSIVAQLKFCALA